HDALPILSASAITEAACRKPLGASSSGRSGSRPSRRRSATAKTSKPTNPGRCPRLRLFSSAAVISGRNDDGFAIFRGGAVKARTIAGRRECDQFTVANMPIGRFPPTYGLDRDTRPALNVSYRACTLHKVALRGKFFVRL